MDEVNPPAIVQNVENLLTKAHVVLMFSERVRDRNRMNAGDILGAGQVLTEIKEGVGHGHFEEFMEQHLPSIPLSTARRWMQRFKTLTLNSLGVELDAASHAGDGSSDSGEGVGEKGAVSVLTPPEPPPEGTGKTLESQAQERAAEDARKKRRKRMLDLLRVTRPKHANKIQTGRKLMTDEQLEKIVPPSCRICWRDGPRPNCRDCAKLRDEAREDKKKSKQEPLFPDDPTSPAEPQPSIEEQLASLTIEYTRLMTQFVRENPIAHDALTKCGVIDHPPGELPRYRAVAGVKKVIEMLAEGVTSIPKLKHGYDIASGRLVAPMFEYKHKGKES